MYRIDLLTFVDFVLSSGVDKVRRAEPHKNPLLRDFWAPWRAAIRAGLEVGDLGDSRKARIYPVHTGAYRAAIASSRAERWNLGQINPLAVGDLTIEMQPDVSLLVQGRPVDVWCWHGAQGVEICSAERMGLLLAGARLGGFTPGVIDLQRGAEARVVCNVPKPPSVSDVALLFRAEAHAFVTYRRHAEARAK